MLEIDLSESRYHRQELITWWDQSKLRSANVLVVGAGAVGNEVVKNLCLVGVGKISIVDMDTIEHSNLARCVFFRNQHEGEAKAKVLADEAAKINSDVELTHFVMPVQRLGIGQLNNYDIIIGALDNREARAWVNQAARKLGKYWVDAAIEGLRGLVRVFGVEGPCYECTLTDADYKAMSHRRSCALLAPHEIQGGKTPTNATTAGIVAGIQVQETIKYIVGQESMMALVGKVWQYIGDSMSTYITKYQENEDCMAHDSYVEIHARPHAKTLRELSEEAENLLGEPVLAIDLEEELIHIKACEKCGGEEYSRLRSSFGLGAGVCATCGVELVDTYAMSLDALDPRLSVELMELGFPLSDIVTVRSHAKRVHFRIGAAR